MLSFAGHVDHGESRSAHPNNPALFPTQPNWTEGFAGLSCELFAE
jgi:hypothetical protein